MNQGVIASRYARALYEEAKAQAVDSEIYGQLGVLLANPAAEQALSPLLAHFFQMLIDNRRTEHLRHIIYIYRDLYRAERAIDRVVFETAVTADDATVAHLVAKVKEHTGREVELVRKVNPALIGGFRLRVADHRYDCSFSGRLEQIRQRLMSEPDER